MSRTPKKAIIKFEDSVFIEHFTRALVLSKKVKVQGLGVFEVKDVAGKKAYNVGLGQMQMIKPYKKIKFRPTKDLKDKISQS